MGKLELITKKVDLLLGNHATLLAEKNGLTIELEEANNEIEILKSKLQDLQENYEMKDLEVDDILSKLEAIVVESNQ